ncbi:FAD-binding oxidoreductase [Methylobacterium brachiatum]|uniref:FAD-binding oxidoreductase n=1 Tax=Methylobacterium brachiatum TaxID=269660 RepID=UPI002447582E|nr:FAD-binding oxidoreductase [Methylobacterium brachiatum]MDH2309533.1 FAD-binding oxidoreductase [Methylobacterium brachiatum]
MSSATPVTEPIVFRWHQAEITAIAPVTPQVKSFRLRSELAQAYRAGQHVDVRLTAEDGYQAQRSYSIASAPDGSGTLELMVEALPDGEVSGWFSQAAEVGDRVELRGPIGGSFSWDGPDGGPLLLGAGGSGVVPLLAMLRRRALVAPQIPAALIYSARTREEAIALPELERLAGDGTGFSLHLTTTRDAGGRRIDAALVAGALARVGRPEKVFLCGSNRFVGAASDLILDAGVPAGVIRTERFGS